MSIGWAKMTKAGFSISLVKEKGVIYMAGLPNMIYPGRNTAALQLTFGSYMHTKSASNGDIYDMKNLSSDFFPLLSVRKRRKRYGKKLKVPNGLYAKEKIYYVDGESFYAEGESFDADGEKIKKMKKIDGFTLTNSKKIFCALGDYLIILPDKKYYRFSEESYGSIEASFKGTVKFCDGTIYGEAAKANTLSCEGADFGSLFKVGDAVSISGCEVEEKNNKSCIIREISKDGNSLIFDENIFSIASETEYTEKSVVTVSRTMPDMDFLICNENRLWGCKGDEIYACKPGDIFNWNVFDGISTDSYSVMAGSAGSFTGAVSFMGYPIFFKDEHIYKVYGDKPSNFQLISSASLGVSEGNYGSLAISGEMLFYLSRAGICVYSGGIPGNASEAFGEDRYENAVAGSDGIKYYISMKNTLTDKYSLFVYDTRRGIWMKEDDTEVISFAFDGALYMLRSDGYVYVIDNGSEKVIELDYAEDYVEWECEFADIYESTAYRSRSSAIYTKKGVGKFLIRLELGDEAKFKAEIMFDSDGKWHTVSELSTTVKKTVTLPIIPRRADHYKLRFTGEGECIIYSIARKFYQGSEF